MSAAHSILAPSSAARWVACAASVLMEAMFPETEDDKHAADEGTAAHWAAAEMLNGQLVALGQIAPNGVPLSDEMIDAAAMYVDAIDQSLAVHGLTRESLHVEERVDIHGIHALNWGTPDAWFYAPGPGVLALFDFKFGHRFVSEFENWQLIDYAAGILDKLEIDGHSDQWLRVEMTIAQPRSYDRAGPVRTWRTTGAELRPYFNQLRHAAEDAMQTGAASRPNPECLHCRARHACDALQRDAYRSAALSGSSIPVDITPAALGLELHFLRAAMERMKGRISGLEEQAKQLLNRGERVPHFALVQSNGREKWAKPVEEVVGLGALFNLDFNKPREPVTPNQARTMLKKAGLPAEVIVAYSARSSSVELAPDNGSDARRVFSQK